jgi:Pyridoxamine 5'-phosphate oxidase
LLLMRGPPTVTPLHHDECLALLSGVALGSLGLNIGALPAIRSVWFTLHSDRVVFRAAPGSNLSQAAGAVVAFHADHYDPSEQQGWCVHAVGLCEEVADPPTSSDLRLCLFEVGHSVIAVTTFPARSVGSDRAAGAVV